MYIGMPRENIYPRQVAMPSVYCIYRELEVVCVSNEGRVGAKEIAERISRLAFDTDWQPGLDIISDYSMADLSQVSHSGMRVLAESYKDLAKTFAGSKVVAIAPSPIEYATLRLWESYGLLNFLTARVCVNFEGARRFLGKQLPFEDMMPHIRRDKRMLGIEDSDSEGLDTE